MSCSVFRQVSYCLNSIRVYDFRAKTVKKSISLSCLVVVLC